MATRKTTKKPRSPVTGKVFEAFISKLRTDPQIDDAVCDRLGAALTSGQTINAASLKNALFPERGVDDE